MLVLDLVISDYYLQTYKNITAIYKLIYIKHKHIYEHQSCLKHTHRYLHKHKSY
jgi:hypothetical protein